MSASPLAHSHPDSQIGCSCQVSTVVVESMEQVILDLSYIVVPNIMGRNVKTTNITNL